jgi:hypothetical protein
MISTQQRNALRRPCYFAVETAHPRYVRRYAENPFASIIVTINTGYE